MPNDTAPNPQDHGATDDGSQTPPAPAALVLKDYKCDLVWKHTTGAHRLPGRVLLNQVIKAHSAESLAAVAFQTAFTHAAESTAIAAEDRGYMVLGSAFVPTGDSNELTEINTNPSPENNTHIKHYLNFRKDDSAGSKIYVFPNDQEAQKKGIEKVTFTTELVNKWMKDGDSFVIQVFPRGRYIPNATRYAALCPPPQVERDRAQAPAKSVADEWAEVAKSRLSHILGGNHIAWFVLGSHLAGLPSDSERELVLKTLEPPEFFAELAPKNPLTSEQMQYLKDAASHSRDILAANRRRIERFEATLSALTDCVGVLKVQVEIMKEATIQDGQRMDAFEANMRLQENRYAMYWAGKVTDAYDKDHEDPNHLDPARRPLAQPQGAGVAPSSGALGEFSALPSC